MSECSTEGCRSRRHKRSRHCDTHRRKISRRRPSRSRRVVYLALSPEEWVQLWFAQGGKCAICRQSVTNRYNGTSEGARAFLDHDHAIEKRSSLRASLRGLLCFSCNRYILVALRDSWERAERAADYLKNPPARSLFNLDILAKIPAGGPET